MATKSVTKCSNSSLEEFISSVNSNQLVNLDKKNITDNDLLVIIEQLIVTKQCRELSLNQNLITDQGLQLIADCLRQNPRLERLNLNENSITDRAILTLVNILINENRNLLILSLENLKLGPTSGIHFGRMLTMNKTLTQLLIANNQLKDRGMNTILFALQNNINLTKLDVRNNQLTDRSFQAIQQLLEVNRGLIDFLLEDNQFSKETYEQLKQFEDKYEVHLFNDM